MSYIDAVIDDFVVKGKDIDIVGPVQFAQEKWGLGVELYPSQRFLLKLLFGEELDTKNRTIVVRTADASRTLFRLSEGAYLRYLYHEGRCSIGEQNGPIEELVWSGGRKTTKTFLIAFVIMYQTYRVLSYYNPHEHFEIPQDREIRCTNLGSSEDQAGLVFSEVLAGVGGSSFFRSLLHSEPGATKIKLLTRYQADRIAADKREAKFTQPGLVIRVAPSTARGVRGPNNICLVFDEFAHFPEEAKNASADQLYEALKPSIAKFAGFAKVASISSPGPRSGKFYQLHEAAMRTGTSDLVYLETPTAEFNHTISAAFIQKEYAREPASAEVEYGAKWGGTQFKFVQRPDKFDLCFRREPSLTPPYEYRGVPYYMGGDLGLSSDGTAFAVAHAEGDTVVVDNVIWYYPGVGQYEMYDTMFFDREIETDRGVKRVGLIHDLKDFVRMFAVRKGMIDQWNAGGFCDIARRESMPWVESSFFDARANWTEAEVFVTLYTEGHLLLPIMPGLRQNLLDLERKQLNLKVGDKYIYKVEAPHISDAEPPLGHDDIWWAISHAVYLVYVNEIQTGRSAKQQHVRSVVKSVKQDGRRVESQRMQTLRQTQQRYTKQIGGVRRRGK